MEEDKPLVAWQWCLCYYQMDALAMSCEYNAFETYAGPIHY